MDCCELARLALWIIGGAFGVILALLAMFFNYNLRLGTSTLKLEKKNGHESEQIKKLQDRLKALEDQPKKANA